MAKWLLMMDPTIVLSTSGVISCGAYFRAILGEAGFFSGLKGSAVERKANMMKFYRKETTVGNL